MSVRHAGSIALAVVVVASMVHLAAFYPRLPDRVASHFGTDGLADGWMSKSTFVSTMILIQLFIAIFFIMGAFALQRIPDKFVNIPHRQYWLAPERKRYALEIMGGFMVWMGVATSFFIVGVTHIVCEANLLPDPRLQNSFVLFLVFYLVVVTVGVVFLIIHFNRIPKNKE